MTNYKQEESQVKRTALLGVAQTRNDNDTRSGETETNRHDYRCHHHL
ncbi:MAG: hypothetical protein KME06_14770 [Kastovskya adunca ATA6-11-RM4]|nr:hypothetical protein [Kastovskya adunca ATA6-11-RM4]